MADHILATGELLVEVMRTKPDQPLSRPSSFAGPFASGAPAIFAVAAARLGVRVDLVGVLSTDPFGRTLISDRLQAESVGQTGVRHVAAPATGVAFIAYAVDGNRAFLFHARHAATTLLAPHDVADIDFSQVAFLHITGSTLLLSDSAHPTCEDPVRRAAVAGARISFDPNMRSELGDGTVVAALPADTGRGESRFTRRGGGAAANGGGGCGGWLSGVGGVRHSHGGTKARRSRLNRLHPTGKGVSSVTAGDRGGSDRHWRCLQRRICCRVA